MLRVSKRLVLVAFSVAIAHATPAMSQGLSAFGAAAPMPDVLSQIRSLTNAEKTSVENTRSCNISIPLMGGGHLIDADIDTLKRSAAVYAAWERDFRAGVKPNNAGDPGKLKYLYHRSQGVSAKNIDLFTRTFLVRALYNQGRDDEALIEANKLIVDYRIRPTFHQVDEGEKATYITDDTLGNATYFFAALSRIRINKGRPEKFSAVYEYLSMRDELLPTIALFNQTEADQEILDDAGPLAVEAANGSLGSTARENIAAAWVSSFSDSPEAFVVLKGLKPVTLKLDIDGIGPPPPPPRGPKASASADEPPRKRGSNGSGDGNGSDGGFSRIKPDAILATAIVTAGTARAAYRLFVEHQVAERSTKDMLLFDVQRDEDGALITIAQATTNSKANRDSTPGFRTFHISESEFKSLGEPGAAGAIAAITQMVPHADNIALVAYSNPFSSRTHDFRDAGNVFAFQLQRAEPNVRIYRDPLSARTSATVRELSDRKLGRATDYIAYIDDGSFKVTDFNVIGDIKKTLTSTGIRVVSGVPKPIKAGPSKNVLVISAHSDEQLAEFVDALGASGAFKNNFVILNSCETVITQAIADKITTQFGAKAAFVHQGLIPVSDVQDVLVGLSKELKAKSQSSLVDTLRNLVHKSGLNGIWSVCERILADVLNG